MCVSSFLAQPVAWLCESVWILCLWVDRYKSSAAERKLCYSWEKPCLNRGMNARGLSTFLFFIFSFACPYLNARWHAVVLLRTFNWTVFGYEKCFFQNSFGWENYVSVYYTMSRLSQLVIFQSASPAHILISVCSDVCMLQSDFGCYGLPPKLPKSLCNIQTSALEACALELRHGSCQHTWSMRCLWKHW